VKKSTKNILLGASAIAIAAVLIKKSSSPPAPAAGPNPAEGMLVG